ncbi:hypothetical protein CKO19_15380 [Rhodovulum adriaticum]|nr:hypothetical protein [Rhodovulum adriaticum]
MILVFPLGLLMMIGERGRGRWGHLTRQHMGPLGHQAGHLVHPRVGSMYFTHWGLLSDDRP